MAAARDLLRADKSPSFEPPQSLLDSCFLLLCLLVHEGQLVAYEASPCTTPARRFLLFFWIILGGSRRTSMCRNLAGTAWRDRLQHRLKQKTAAGTQGTLVWE